MFVNNTLTVANIDECFGRPIAIQNVITNMTPAECRNAGITFTSKHAPIPLNSLIDCKVLSISSQPPTITPFYEHIGQLKIIFAELIDRINDYSAMDRAIRQFAKKQIREHKLIEGQQAILIADQSNVGVAPERVIIKQLHLNYITVSAIDRVDSVMRVNGNRLLLPLSDHHGQLPPRPIPFLIPYDYYIKHYSCKSIVGSRLQLLLVGHNFCDQLMQPLNSSPIRTSSSFDSDSVNVCSDNSIAINYAKIKQNQCFNYRRHCVKKKR